MRSAPLLPALFALIIAAPGAQAHAQNRAGDFDHYLLALSWMPAFCELEGDARDDPRCEAGSAHGWMVHGLWPQHRGGAWPEYCTTAHPAPSRRETAAQSDLYGTGGAAWHQWNKHGRCTGLSAPDYYRLTRLALDRLTLPAIFGQIDRALVVAPEVIEDAFIEANAGLDETMMITTCRNDALVELRLCLTRELEPRPCDREIALRECALDAARLHPLR